MSGDVHDTLNELERKLRELQAELRGPEAPGAEPPPPPPPSPPLPPPPSPGGVQDQLAELLRFRDQLAEAATKLVEDYSRVLEQISRAAGEPPTPTPASGHATFPVPPPTAPSAESTMFSGDVTVEADPFADIASVAAFEEALRQVPHAEHVAVRSFAAERAVVEVRLAAEVPLVFELRRASDRAFDVEQAEAGRLVLTMHPVELPFPARP